MRISNRRGASRTSPRTADRHYNGPSRTYAAGIAADWSFRDAGAEKPKRKKKAFFGTEKRG